MKSMKKLVLVGLILLASVMVLVGCQHEVEAQHAHTGGAATCTTKAKCSECGAEYGVLNPENHENEGFTYTDNGDGTHTKKTMCCKVPVGEVEKHTGGTATCSAKATCSECGFEYRNPENHEKDELLYTKHVCCEILEIDGSLGDKSVATDEDINALVEQLKTYVDNGITTIIVTGENPAIIKMDSWINTAIGEAIYRLSGSDMYDENNPYNGKIDLILQDVTEIVDQEFYAAFALNSITLPKVTTVGDGAFTGCYYLKKMTFGSVVTSINQSNSYVFYEVGKEVDGGSCDLVLNCGQLQTEDTYKPDLENNVWFKPSWGGNVTWKSITLTHTSECDECKANQ